MSKTEELKNYLIHEVDGYLLNDDNNGKTIMLSGAWGSGKTHFWQNEIEPKLSVALKENDKSSTYISLYGKDSLSELKKEVFIKASTENALLSKEVSTFGFEALSSIEESDLAIGKVLNAAKGLNSYRKSTKGIKRLKDGGIICFDDFERKSKAIDLNDLFGFISQLAIDMNCKVVIILNSNVFEGEEANIFKTVKEKTVNKFLYFKPTIEELFNLIFDRSEKYCKLEKHKEEILKAIKDTEELNARIYIQVFDNCLEWIDKGYENNILRAVVLSTIYFIKSHDILTYGYLNYDDYDGAAQYHSIDYQSVHNYPLKIVTYIKLISTIGDMIHGEYGEPEGKRTKQEYKELIKQITCTHFVDKVKSKIVQKNTKGTYILSETEQKYYLDWLEKSKNEICEFWKYGYRLFYMDTIEEEIYNKLSEFIKTGILLPKEAL